jgi:hypothetical protein
MDQKQLDLIIIVVLLYVGDWPSLAGSPGGSSTMLKDPKLLVKPGTLLKIEQEASDQQMYTISFILDNQ